MAGLKDRMGKLRNWMVIDEDNSEEEYDAYDCLLYTSPSPRDRG